MPDKVAITLQADHRRIEGLQRLRRIAYQPSLLEAGMEGIPCSA